MRSTPTTSTTLAALLYATATLTSTTAFLTPSATHSLLPSLHATTTITRGRGICAMSSTGDLDRAAKLRAEAEKLEKELAGVMASRPRPVATEEKPDAVVRPYMTFEQIKEEVSKTLTSSGGSPDACIKQMKANGMLSKFESASVKGFRRYDQNSFEQATGFPVQQVESGGTQDDLKIALGVVMALSSLAVVGGSFLGGFVGTLLVYIFLLIPISFIGIGSVAPGVISVGVVAVNNLLDGKAKERKITSEAARFMTGYLLGLPIEKVTQGEDATSVKFYDTIDGNMKDLGFSSTGPDARKKFGQEDILSSAVMAIAGSVAERLEFGKVIDRQADFLYLVALMDIVRPALRAGQKNDLVIYSALQAHKIITSNKSKLERIKEKIAAKAGFEELVAAVGVLLCVCVF